VVVRGADDVARASKAQTRGMAESVNMATEMALGFGGLNPHLRELSIGLAMGGNNAITMANSLGPLGIVLGIVTGVVPILITMLARSGGEMENLEERTARAAETFRDLVSAIRAVREEGERERRAARGELSAEEQRDELGAAESRLELARTKVRDEERRVATMSPAARRRIEALAGVEGFGQMSVEAQTEALSRQEIAEREAGRGATPEQLGRIADRARDLARARQTVEEREGTVTSAREATQVAEARERREAEETETRERPGRLREQLRAIATTGNLTEQQRTRLMTAAEAGRLGSQRGLLGRLGTQGARFEQLSGQLRGADVAAAQQTLEAGRAEDLVQDLDPLGDAAPIQQRVRQAARRAPAPVAAPSTPAAPAGFDPRLLAALERLAQQRVEVRVRVDDERARADVVDASASDLTGGQQ
jgi:hypothetical protein